MIVCHSRLGFGTRRRIGEKSKGLPEREERRKGKRLFFDTTEATNLLKIKDRVFEIGKNGLVFKRQLAPKCTPRSPFLPIRDPICACPGPNYRGLHGVSGFAILHPTDCGYPPNPHWGIILTPVGGLAGTVVGKLIPTGGWHDVYRAH
jgi:hypothetical protein